MVSITRPTSRHAALRRDCLYPPARPCVLVSHAPGVTSRFWLACRPTLARPSTYYVSHARGHASSQSDYYIDAPVKQRHRRAGVLQCVRARYSRPARRRVLCWCYNIDQFFTAYRCHACSESVTAVSCYDHTVNNASTQSSACPRPVGVSSGPVRRVILIMLMITMLMMAPDLASS